MKASSIIITQVLPAKVLLMASFECNNNIKNVPPKNFAEPFDLALVRVCALGLTKSYSAPLPKFSQDCRHNWLVSELRHGKGMGCAAAHFFGGEERQHLKT